MKIVRLLILFCSFLFLGCGYNFLNNKNLPFGIKNICVEMFQNHTEELGLESLITDEFIKQLMIYLPSNRLNKVDAEGIIKGSIVSFYHGDIDIFKKEISSVNSYRRCFTIAIELILSNLEEDILWVSEEIEAVSNYIVIENDEKLTSIRKERALRELLEKISIHAIQALIERF